MIISSLCSVAQSCPTLCDPTDCSPPGSSVHGIFQAKMLKWVAFPPPGIASWIDVYSCDRCDPSCKFINE